MKLILSISFLLLLELFAHIGYHTFDFAKDNPEIIKELQLKGQFSMLDGQMSRYSGQYSNESSIDIFGCSYCYGHKLKDNQTLSYKLQSLTDQKVNNYCITGIGIDVIYANFLKSITDSTNKVIINYCYFQQERQSYSRWMSKIVARSISRNAFEVLQDNMLIPVIDKDTILYKTIKPINLGIVRYSALFNLIDDHLLEYKKSITGDINQTARILLKMQSICESKGIKFVVNNGDGNKETKKHFELFKSYGINLLDLNIDIAEQSYNLGSDSHPSEKANTQMANGIYVYLCI